MSYDDGNYTVRREYFAGEAGGAATTEYGKFRAFQEIKLKKVHAIPTVAGTVVGHAFDVYSGTTSIGTIATGTTTVNANPSLTAVISSGVLDQVVSAGGQVSVKSKADATGKAHIVFEYEVTAASVKS